ncbi:MAG: CARDB domain-containing protein [Fervidicoccaceae archaeon]
MKNKAIFLSLLILFSFLYITSPSQAQQEGGLFTVLSAYWGSQQSPACVGAGMQMQQLNVVLKYNGNSTYGGVKGLLYLPSYLSDSLSGGSIATATSMSPLVPGQTLTLSYWIDVSNGAPAGYYQAFISMYVYDSGAWKNVEIDPFTITLSSTPSIALAVPTIISTPPGYVNLSIPIQNGGSGYAYGALLTASSSQQQVLVLNQSIKIGTIGPMETYQAEVPLYISPSAAGSLIPISFKLSFLDSCGIAESYSTSIYLSIQQPSSPQLSVQLAPTVLTAGTNSTLSVLVINSGNQTAKSLTVSLELPQQLLSSGGSSSLYLGDLQSNQSATANFSVLPLGISGSKTVLQLYVDLSYTDSYGISRMQRIPFLLTIVQPKSVLSIDLEPHSLMAGGKGNITVTITNSGNTSISGLDVTISPSQSMSFLGFDGRWYVGDLLPGESRSIAIQVIVQPTASGMATLTLSMSYTDSTFTARTESRTESILIMGSPTVSNFLVTPSPQSVVGGLCCSQINLTITSTAAKRLDNVSLTISPGNLIIVGSSGRFYLGSINPGESRSVSFSVYANAVQSIQYATLAAAITYTDPTTGSIISENDPFTLMIVPATSKLPLQISTETWIVTAGQTNYLNLSLINPNSFALGQISITLTPPSGTILPGTGNYYIDSLGPGETTQISIPLYIPSTMSSSTVALTASISYFDGSTITSTSKTLTFLLALPPSLKITNYAVLPQTISPGQTFSASLTIANTGIGPAYNVTIAVLPSPLYSTLLGSQSFINQLNSGSSTTVTFSFRLSSNVNATTFPGNETITRTFTRTFTQTQPVGNITRTYPIGESRQPIESVNFVITYSDNVGKQYSTELSIPLTISPSSNNTSTTAINTSSTSLHSYVLPTAIAVVAILTIYISLRAVMRGKK